MINKAFRDEVGWAKQFHRASPQMIASPHKPARTLRIGLLQAFTMQLRQIVRFRRRFLPIILYEKGTKMHVKLAGLLLTLGLVTVSAQEFNKPYDIGVNGANPGASQWFRLNIEVNSDGVVVIHTALENDVLRGWSGSFRFEFHDLKDNALLFRIDSPMYSICAKPAGKAIRVQADDITVSMAPEIAKRFIARPSMYGVKRTYDQGDWFFCGSGKLLEQVGQAIATPMAN